MHYRPEIDGLRAVAVIPVILFHAGFTLFAGGYVGVDVFFVISGYLITGIILAELAAGKFSLSRFYLRRVFRILPLLYVVSLLCIPFVLALFPPHQVKDFSQSLVSVGTFTSNIFFYLETDYFNDFAESAPLLHTWSLAVEEQFYLFFPALLILCSRFRKGVLFAVLLLGGLCSYLYSLRMLNVDQSFAFYMLPTRFWELGCGALVAALHHRGMVTENRWLSDGGSLLGLLAIGAAVLLFDKNTPFPGHAALLPVAGAALIIYFGNSARYLKALLANDHLRWIGLLSYGLYLWHQPVFAFARAAGLPFDATLPRFAVIALCLALATLSYHLIERPFRRPQSEVLLRLRYYALPTVLVSLLGIGYLGHRNNGFQDYLLANIPEDIRAEIIDQERELNVRSPLWRSFLRESGRPFDAGRDGVLILGDSKSEDLYVATQLNARLHADKSFRRLRLDDTCMAQPESLGKLSQVCRREMARLLDSGLLEQASLVVLSATWQYSSNGNVLDFVGWLDSIGKRVKIVSTGNFNDVASLSFVVAREGMSEESRGHFLFSNIRSDWSRQYERLKAAVEAGYPAVEFIEKLDLFCDWQRESCELRSNDNWLMFDTGHLTVEGAQEVGERIFRRHWYD